METLFKSRSSAMGKITVGISLKPLPLTEKQEKELQELREKDSKSKKRIELEDRLVKIPEAKLSSGAKTYIRKCWYEENFDFVKRFTNKYTEKGNTVESRSIKALSKYLGFYASKNEQYLENDYTKGTPDFRLKKPSCTIDTKNVYYPDGLHFFEEENEKSDYEWQIHSYNFLDKKEDGFVARILMNPPENIIKKEAWTLWKESENEGEFDESFLNEVRDLYDFESKKPIDERVNLFHVKTTQYEIDVIKKSAELANEYYHELNEKFKGRNIDSLEFFNK